MVETVMQDQEMDHCHQWYTCIECLQMLPSKHIHMFETFISMRVAFDG